MRSISFLAALLLAACTVQPVPPMTSESSQSTIPGPILSVERTSTGTLRLTLDNGSTAPIGYNLCTSQLQRQDGNAWVNVPTDEVCTMELRTLNPGADATFEKRLPARLAGGVYRYVTSVENPVDTKMTPVATAPFSLP